MQEEPTIIRQPQTNTNLKRLVEFVPDTYPPGLFSIDVTLQAIPGDVTRLEIPEGTCGVRLFSEDGDIRFAVDKDPTLITASSDVEINANAYASGNTVEESFFEVRTFESTAKTLRLTGIVGSEVVRVEFF